MPTPAPSGNRIRAAAAQAGVVASALAVFTCGWLAMRSQEWPRILLYSLLALAAAALASFFRRRTR